MSTTRLEHLVDRLTGAPGREGRLTHLEVLPPRVARSSPWPDWVDPDLVTAWKRCGIVEPWQHQVEAASLAHAGEHAVLATGTASGKSLGYLMPALTAIQAKRGPRGQRGSSTLYVSPTKALAQDQLNSLRSLGVTDLRVATHDGDSSPEEREWTRDHGEYVLTNPDMLHRSLLPGHERWTRFFAALDFVVIDECHHYRGVFGAHVSQIMRRLRRVAALYG
ncbi:MAG: DEAD/DEAH box helicase, partial [Marmoricola sp.]